MGSRHFFSSCYTLCLNPRDREEITEITYYLRRVDDTKNFTLLDV